MGVKKLLDVRIRTLIQNGVHTRQRTFFVIIGDHARDQVANLYYIYTKASPGVRPPVLWCYKNELGFSTNKKRRMKNLKRSIQKGTYDPNTDDPFELFMSSTSIRWLYYKDTHRILGNTFGMCVLQDFEAMTPNILVQTIETVQGGGLVVLMLQTMDSLKQLYTLAMDIHARFKTDSHKVVKARFNERFLLSLSACRTCLILDDELNVMSLSKTSRSIEPVSRTARDAESDGQSPELASLKQSLLDTEIVGQLISKAKTLDQAKAVLTSIDAISEKTLRATVVITAPRGRGKSAALGLSVSAAIAFGYSNVFITSPTPENLKTTFEFVFKGFDSLGWKEHLDYELIQSTNPSWNGCIVRINVFKTHRQTVQYISPTDSNKLGQAELLVIDEAAAIPLPYVKKLLGPYLVFMASTVNGYEGTGRSLSLKLIKQLRESSTMGGSNDAQGRVLKEVSMQDPIRYAENDPVEAWLNHLLCLDATVVKNLKSGCPHPSECDLYYVNRDTLFSYHKASECFLQRLVAIFVSAHYKNTPNDLQMMADAPAHHLFVLLPPIASDATTLPEVLCVIQVCLEGGISSETISENQHRGLRAPGDLIPWTLSQQFQDENFPKLRGARIVRISTHPDYQAMGYGSRALNLLQCYYNGELVNLNRIAGECEPKEPKDGENEESSATLLLKLHERPPEPLHYLGVSFGLTKSLLSFWKKARFFPLYLRLTPNELTGEHTLIMQYPLPLAESAASSDWQCQFYQDFRKRLLTLLSYEFRDLPCDLALLLLNVRPSSCAPPSPITRAEIQQVFSIHDIKRLEGYANHLLDFHVIIDLLPSLAQLFFLDRVSGLFHLSAIQCWLLLGLGLQRKTLDTLAEEVGVQASQLMALLNKIVRKFVKVFRTLEEADEYQRLPSSSNGHDEHDSKQLEQQQSKLLKSLPLKEYIINDSSQNWDEATASIGQDKIPNTISVPTVKAPSRAQDGHRHKQRHQSKKRIRID
ncbi:RNA cytidine acetyltransferase-like [Schistocerca gregaria]|uniref:RNA cytidine acetyltransferase-like n=1 Tax=Schistocerca gregaria TaxID=7010 RepID=UPI00211EA6DB|nr:RNA cytidine acetyltransferase-like [Schistocerca gregaria]